MNIDPRPTVANGWRDPDPTRPVPFWPALRQDILAHVAPDRRNRSALGWALLGTAILLRSSGLHMLLLYRLAHTLRHRLGRLGVVPSAFLFWCGRHAYGCAIASTARLHGGMILPHPQNIVIGAQVVVGPRAFIFQNVTIGGAPGKVGQPTIGADARIFTGAVVTGPVVLGDSVVVGANVVVYHDVPSWTSVRPAMPELRPIAASLPEPTQV